MWAALRPDALVPLWQLKQPVVMPACVNVDGRQASVEWQVLQVAVVGICEGPRPCAVVLLWQEAQVPVTCVWSTRAAGCQAAVTWQDSQTSVVAMCVALRPIAVTPLWHPEQPVVTPV